MNITIDASAVIAVINGEPTASDVLTATHGVKVVSPASLPWEIANAFSAMFKRGAITEELALKALALYQKMDIELVDVQLDDSLKLAAKLDIYAYDAFVLACAVSRQSLLLTLDRGLRYAAGRLSVPIVEWTP